MKSIRVIQCSQDVSNWGTLILLNISINKIKKELIEFLLANNADVNYMYSDQTPLTYPIRENRKNTFTIIDYIIVLYILYYSLIHDK